MRNFNDFAVNKVIDMLTLDNWDVQVEQNISTSKKAQTGDPDEYSKYDHTQRTVVFKIFRPDSIYFPVILTFINLDIAFDAEWQDTCISFETTLVDEDRYGDVVYMMGMAPMFIKKIKREFQRWAEIFRAEIDNAQFYQRKNGEGLRKWRESLSEQMKDHVDYRPGVSAKADRLEAQIYLAYHVYIE